MQKLIFLFCLCSSLHCFGQNDKALVIAQMQAQESSWNNGDLIGFMQYYWKSDSLKFIGSKGITFGWQKTLDNYIKGYPDKASMGVLKFSIKECTQLSPTSIYIIGSWELQKEKPAGRYFTLLWKRVEDKWVIVADHTS